MESPAAPESSDQERESSLLLDDQVCFALYAASRAVTGLYRPVLEELGLTYPQYLVMLALWEHDSVPVKDLGAVLHLDYGTLTPLLKRLEVSGLIRRERRAEDERSVLIALTDAGTALRERAMDLPPMIFDALGLTWPELDQVSELLRRIAANSAAHAAERG